MDHGHRSIVRCRRAGLHVQRGLELDVLQVRQVKMREYRCPKEIADEIAMPIARVMCLLCGRVGHWSDRQGHLPQL